MKLFRIHFLRRWARLCKSEWAYMSLVGRAFTLCLLILPATTWLAWKPARGWIQQKRVHHRIALAEQALQKGEYAAAASFARLAKEAGGSDGRIDKILAESLDAISDPNAVRAQIAILSNPAAPRPDRLQAFRQLLPSFCHGDVQRLWLRLSEAERADLDFRLTMTDRVLADGDARSALRFLQATEITRFEPALEIRRIRAWIQTGSSESLDLAHRAIVELWKLLPEQRSEWLDLIEEIPLEKLDPLCLGELEADLVPPAAAADARTRLLTTRLHLAQAFAAGQEDKAAEIIRQAIRDWLESDPLPLCRFLIHGRQWGAISDHFTDAIVEGQPELVQARLEALARLGLKMSIPLTLSCPANAIESHWCHAWHAACHHHAGEVSEAKAAWDLALQEASGDTRETILLELAAHAARHGMEAEHDSAMLAAIRSGLGPLPSFASQRRLIERLEEQGAESKLMTLLESYRKMEPWEPEIEVRYCHLSALLGSDSIPACIETLEALAAKLDSAAHPRTVLACLHLLAGDSKRSLEQWQRLPIARHELSPRFQAAWQIAEIHAASSDGLTTPARPENLNWAILLPAERRHYQRLLRVEESSADLPELPPLPEAKPLPELPPLPEAKPLPELPPLPEAKPLPELPPLPEAKPLPELPPLPANSN